MSRLGATLHADATEVHGDDDALLVVMKDRGVRVQRQGEKDREWLLRVGTSVITARAHRFGSVAAPKRYLAALSPDHLVTWAAGFERALHLAPGIRLGAEITHILVPQTRGVKGCLKTQACCVLVKGADRQGVYLFNPYTTELAGPIEGLELPEAGDGQKGFEWAQAGVEEDDESYFVYAVPELAKGTMVVMRVTPRSYGVTVAGTADLPKGTTKLHLERNAHWVALVGKKLMKSPVSPSHAFDWAPVAAKGVTINPDTQIGFTDTHVLAVATPQPSTNPPSVLVWSVDLNFSTQLEQATLIQDPSASTIVTKRASTLYAATPGKHWVAFGSGKLVVTPSVLGATTLAGSMLQQKASQKAQQVAKPGKVVVAKVACDASLSGNDLLEAWGKAVKQATKDTVQQASAVKTYKEADIVTAASQLQPFTRETLVTMFETALSKRYWEALQALLTAASGRRPSYLLTSDLAPSLFPTLLKHKRYDLYKTATRSTKGPVPTQVLVKTLAQLLGSDSWKNRGTLSRADSLLTCGLEPPSVDLAIDLDEGLTVTLKARFLEYLYLRLVARADCINQDDLTKGGVPSAEVLCYWTGCVLDGCSEDLALHPACHEHILNLARLCRYGTRLSCYSSALPGQLTAVFGTPGHRHANPPDIDSKDLSLGPLRSRAPAAPVRRHTLVI